MDPIDTAVPHVLYFIPCTACTLRGWATPQGSHKHHLPTTHRGHSSVSLTQRRPIVHTPHPSPLLCSTFAAGGVHGGAWRGSHPQKPPTEPPSEARPDSGRGSDSGRESGYGCLIDQSTAHASPNAVAAARRPSHHHRPNPSRVTACVVTVSARVSSASGACAAV